MSKRNVVLSVAAVGLLVVGLLVLIPEPVRAIQPQAPIINVLDRDSATTNTLQTRLTTTVIIPKGEVIPLSHVAVERITGTPTGFDGDGTLTGGAACSSGLAIQSISGGSLSSEPVRLGGYGYSTFSSNGYGYGYDFSGSPAFFDFGSFDNGYGAGYGYGYGYNAASDTTMTVVVVVNDCPAATEFTGNAALTFTFQVLIGGQDMTGDGGKLFVSLPTTITLVNPELTATGTAASAGTVTTTVQTGTGGTTISYTFPGDGDATHENLPAGPITLPIPSGAPFVVSLTATVTGSLPEGSTLGVSFLGAGSSGLNIPAADVATLTGGAGAAGFMGITLSGFSTATGVITIAIDVEVPTTYFTANGFSTSLFSMARYSDAGVRTTPDPSCVASTTAPSAGNNRFTCTISSFSSFAMVASVAAPGGGGPASSTTLTAPTTPTTPTTPTASTNPTATGSDSQTSSKPDSATKAPGKKNNKGIPGVELGLLAAALGGLALAARRKLE